MAEEGDIFETSVKMDMPGGWKAFNIFAHHLTDGDATDAQVLTALQTLVTAAYGYIQAEISDQVTMNLSPVNKVIWSGAGWVVDRIVGTILPTNSFTNTSDMLPHAVCGLVQFPTTAPRVVGKKFVSGFGEDRQDESDLTPQAAAALLQFANQILTPTAAGNGFLRYRILRKDGTLIGSTVAHIATVVSSQKRRKPGVGI